MKLDGFDEKGRIIVDGEGDTILVDPSIAGNDCVLLRNTTIKAKPWRWNLRSICIDICRSKPFPIRISIPGTERGRTCIDTPCSGEILNVEEARKLCGALEEAIQRVEEGVK